MDNWRNSGSSPSLRDVHELRVNWGWFFGLGVLLVLLGIAAVYSSVFTTLFTVFLLGLLTFGSGVVQIVQSFWARKWSGLFLSLLVGILYLVVGGLFIMRPGLSAINLTLLIAAFFLVSGLFRMIVSLIQRFNDWGWVFINGLISFILGIMIFQEWPAAGLWVIGLFIGIDLILIGITWIILSSKAKAELG